jgi:GT2 family glycosyltransferase
MESVLATIPKGLSLIEVLGFPTLSRFDLAEQLLASIDYPVSDLVIINNSGKKSWTPTKPEQVKNLWHIEVPYGLGLQGAWNLVIKSTPYAPRWLLVNDDCRFEPGALEVIDREAKPDALTFTDCAPVWSAVVLGEEVVKRVGLFDEAFYPLYYCDNDYERRADYAGINKINIPAKVHHHNSATKYHNNEIRNEYTYHRNGNLLQEKRDTNDYSVRGWSLNRRRDHRWD